MFHQNELLHGFGRSTPATRRSRWPRLPSLTSSASQTPSKSSYSWSMSLEGSGGRRFAGTPGTAGTFPTSGSRRHTPCSPAWLALRVDDRKAAASALAELVHRRGLEQASEVLMGWAS
jgi:hypothetical protein